MNSKIRLISTIAFAMVSVSAMASEGFPGGGIGPVRVPITTCVGSIDSASSVANYSVTFSIDGQTATVSGSVRGKIDSMVRTLDPVTLQATHEPDGTFYTSPTDTMEVSQITNGRGNRVVTTTELRNEDNEQIKLKCKTVLGF